jgi:type IV fimbrial biogenesis protein FimT
MQVRSRVPLRPHGLVLLEFLVAGCVLALLTALAVPSFKAISERLKLRSAVEEFTFSLYAARAEAYKRGGHVTFAQKNQDDCKASATGSKWGCGWIAFADEDENGTQEDAEQLIFTGKPPAGIDVESTSHLTALKLNASGQFNGLGAASFVLSSQANGDLMSIICISSGGRVRSVPGKECQG